jgi:hypothetical protein
MPMFGSKKFAYTETGMKDAKAYAKKTGKKMTKKTVAKKAMPKKMGKKK